MQENMITSNFHIDIQKGGLNAEGRQLYRFTDANGNEQVNISVKNKDKDSFEKSISTINKFGENINNPNEQKKNKIKAYTTLLGLGTVGIALPAYITRNSKTLVKSLSIVGGAALGVIGGIIGFMKCLVPKGYKEAQVAQQALQALDIRVEK